MTPRLSALALAGALVLAAQSARAEHVLGAGVEAAAPLRTTQTPGWGFGLNAYWRYEFGVPFFHVGPEAMFSYHVFGDPNSRMAFTPMGGFRFSVGEMVRFSLTPHIGGTYRTFPSNYDDRMQNHWSLYLDGNAALDVRLFKVLDVGVHSTLAWIPASEKGYEQAWISMGAHVGGVF